MTPRRSFAGRLPRLACARHSHRGGASLIETLVAIAVLAIATSLLVSFAADSIYACKRFLNGGVCTLIAGDKIEQVVAARHDLPALIAKWKAGGARSEESAGFVGVNGMEVRDLVDNYAWNVQIEDVKDSPGLKTVRVRVVWMQPTLRGVVEGAAQVLETYVVTSPAKGGNA